MRTFELGENSYAPITHVPCGNSAFLLGESAFETMRVHEGKIPNWKYHEARIAEACAELELSKPNWPLISRIVASESQGRAIARLQICRADMTSGFGSRAKRDLITLSIRPAEKPPSFLMTAIINSPRRSCTSLNSRFKVGSYVDQLAARRAAKSAGADIALMLNEQGRVACFDLASIILVRKHIALTPSTDEGALASTTVASIERPLNDLGIALRRGEIEVCELGRGWDIFAINAGMGAVPVFFHNEPALCARHHQFSEAVERALTGR